MTYEQDGADVVATGSGTIDLTDLTRSAVSSFTNPGVHGAVGFELSGPPTPEGYDYVVAYYGATGPAMFGTSTASNADSGADDVVGLATSGSTSFIAIYVDPSYPSGASLPSSSTYDNATLASLGLTPGVYEYTWGPERTRIPSRLISAALLA